MAFKNWTMNNRIPVPGIWAVLLLLNFSSCKEKETEFSSNQCKGSPAFIRNLGINPAKSYFSTSEIRTMGLVLTESEQPGNPAARITKSIQHPSWRKAGWLAPILIDEAGNIYSAPAPFINILDNPLANNNTIYKVDSRTGVMDEFMRLPSADSINAENPFGIIGIVYLCESGTLYVSTVAGSRRYEENGHIYAINVKTKKIIGQLNHTDAMGMGISYITGKRKLYFGTGRSPVIYSVSLSSDGEFSGSPAEEFTIQDLGPRGDDKVRRITTDQYGNLSIHGIEFNFNLIAPREKQETLYRFSWNADEKKWIFLN